MKYLPVISSAILLLLAGCYKLETVYFDGIEVKVMVADSEIERLKGLMFRENLPENQGMLFVFENQEIRSLWMKNTLMPLDMIFVDSNNLIVDIIENAEPCKTQECPIYTSNAPAMYIIEVNAGFVKKNGIEVGDMVRI